MWHELFHWKMLNIIMCANKILKNTFDQDKIEEKNSNKKMKNFRFLKFLFMLCKVS